MSKSEGSWLPGMRHAMDCRCNRCKETKVNGWRTTVQPASNFFRQARLAETWSNASLTVAAYSGGAKVVHDEISFEDEGAAERFMEVISGVPLDALITLACTVSLGWRDPAYKTWNSLLWELGIQKAALWNARDI